MSTPVSTTPTNGPQVAPAGAGAGTASVAPPRSAQRDRDGGNSKLGTFGVSRIYHHCDPRICSQAKHPQVKSGLAQMLKVLGIYTYIVTV
jgi:hypothetical protein